MSDLLVTAITPTLSSGTGLRTFGVTAALARHGAVEVAYVPWGAHDPATEYRQLANVRLRELSASRGARRALAYASARARGVPHGVARGVSPSLLAAARGKPPDVRVIADGPVVAAALEPLARRRRLVYLAHNLESGGFRPEPLRAGLERLERSVFATYSECWMATRADEHGAKRLGGEAVVTRYVPNVVDTGRIAPVTPAGSGRLLFVGDFTYEPNREALTFLAEDVLPAVWEHLPDVRLSAVGRGLSEGSGDPRIQTPGFVEDLAEAYRGADIVLVPLQRGGGSPLKFIEGLAYGLPVVASRHAAALLEDAVPGRDFVAAGDPAGFAESITGLLSDRARAESLGRAGRKVAEACYSIRALAALLAP